jgi:hypothetical protein
VLRYNVLPGQGEAQGFSLWGVGIFLPVERLWFECFVVNQYLRTMKTIRGIRYTRTTNSHLLIKALLAFILLFSFSLVNAQWTEEQKILAQLPTADFYVEDGSTFGYSIDMDGTSVIVGGRDGAAGGSERGIAAVYSWDGTNWDSGQVLSPPTLPGNARFGESVAISGDWAIVGTGAEDKVHFFKKDVSGTWSFHSTLAPLAIHSSDLFGLSVDISGTVAIVGDTGDDDVAGAAGAAYIYQYNGGTDTWDEIKKLTASDGAASDLFGSDVGITPTTAIVGANGDDDAGSGSGSAYVFSIDEGGVGNWGEVKKLTASDAAAADEFGFSVAIDADRILIGAPENDDSGSNSGSAYLFERNEGGPDFWGEKKKLTMTGATSNDSFGNDVDIDGDRLVIGAKDDEYLAVSDMGTAHVFDKDEGGVDNWGQVATVYPSDLQNQEDFAFSVALSGDHVVCGMPLGDLQGGDCGGWYHYQKGVLSDWTEEITILGVDGQAHDELGPSVAIDGDRAIVGVRYADPKGSQSGKALFFEKDMSGVWQQVAEVFPENGAVSDLFGSSVDISGDRAVVGAPNYGNLGAVFMYERTMSGWDLDTSIVETSSSFGEYLGASVAIEGDMILAGDAPWNISTFNNGSVSVLMRNPVDGEWNRYHRLTHPGGAYGFGCSVDFEADGSGDNIIAVIGRLNTPNGFAYIHQMAWADSSWSYVQELVPSALTSAYGVSVAIDAGRVVVGDHQGAGFSRGQAFLYELDEMTGIWSETQHLTPNLIGSNHSIAYDVDLKGDVLVLGGSNVDEVASNAGVTYVYRQGMSGDFELEQTLTATDYGSNDHFGAAVAIGDGELFITADGDDDNGRDAGAIYVFREEVACTEYNLEFQSGSGIAADVTYEVLDESGMVTFLSGNNPVPANNIGTATICLPDGCYQLRVTDSAGDGLLGYILREAGANGRRIIDNKENMNDGVSQIGGGHGFCVPMSDDRPIFSSCDKLDWVTNRFIVATENAAVTAAYATPSLRNSSGYVFWFYDPNGTYSYRRFRKHSESDGYGTGALRANHFRLNAWTNTPSSPHLPEGVLLNVRIMDVLIGLGEHGGLPANSRWMRCVPHARW